MLKIQYVMGKSPPLEILSTGISENPPPVPSEGIYRVAHWELYKAIMFTVRQQFGG